MMQLFLLTLASAAALLPLRAPTCITCRARALRMEHHDNMPPVSMPQHVADDTDGDNKLLQLAEEQEVRQRRRQRHRHRAVLTKSRLNQQLARIKEQEQKLQSLRESILARDASSLPPGEQLPKPPEVELQSLGKSFTRTATSLPPPGEQPSVAGEQELFRHRFLVSSDLCIRLPIEASTLLRAFVVHSHLAGVVHLQLEAFRPLYKVNFSPDSKRMLSLPNAGGSSLVSEALAFELLARAFGASLQMTETELAYKHGSKMTDFATLLFGGYPLGVSVTRAYKWRGSRHCREGGTPSGLDVCDAKRLLMKKLAAINVSSRCARRVTRAHFWPRLASSAVPLIVCVRDAELPPGRAAPMCCVRAGMCKTTAGASSCSSCGRLPTKTRCCLSGSTSRCRPTCAPTRCCSSRAATASTGSSEREEELASAGPSASPCPVRVRSQTCAGSCARVDQASSDALTRRA